jgi:ketosteroid isomerase-like protein
MLLAPLPCSLFPQPITFPSSPQPLISKRQFLEQRPDATPEKKATKGNTQVRTALAITTFDKQSTDQFDREYEKAFYEGGSQAMASVYTPDAKLLIEDEAIIEGRQAIAEFWKVACERANTVQMKRSIHTDELESSGDLGYKRNTVTLEIPAKEGKTVTHVIKSITVWKREADGVWRIAQDISNRNAPLDPGQFTYGVAVADQATS